MAERKSLDGLTLRDHQGTRIMALGDMEIWDGADLSLLRDGMNHVILKEKRESVAIDMTFVKYVPSGFFGMLFDWFEKGISVRLFAPQECVANMLWFRQFFDTENDGWHVLHDGLAANVPSKSADWSEEEWEAHGDRTTTVSASH